MRSMLTSTLFVLAACGGGETGDAWWNVATSDPWTGPTDGEIGEGEEDDEGEVFEGPFRVLYGEFAVADGLPTAGFVGHYFTRGNEDVVCDFDLEATVTGLADCASCEWSAVVQLGSMGEEATSGTGCEPFASWADQTIGLGVQGESLSYRAPGETAWTTEGFAEREGTEFFFEVELEAAP